MLVDPTAEEEDDSDSTITAVLVMSLPVQSHATNSVDEAPAMLYKPGGMGLKPEHLRQAVSAARSRASKLLPLLLHELK